MKKEKQEIIDKIQKILILAKDQEGKPEGDTAKKHAAILMAKYRIEETEVDLETDNFILDKLEFYNDGKTVPQWIGRCVGVFTNLFDTRAIFRTTYDGQEWEIIGTFSDVEVTKYFIEVATHHILEAARRTWPQKTYWRKRQQLGNEAVDSLWERAWELKEQMDSSIHEDENCTALVVKKEREIDDAIAEMYPNLNKARNKKIDRATDNKTRQAGRKAGQSCPLNMAIDD